MRLVVGIKVGLAVCSGKMTILLVGDGALLWNCVVVRLVVVVGRRVVVVVWFVVVGFLVVVTFFVVVMISAGVASWILVGDVIILRSGVLVVVIGITTNLFRVALVISSGDSSLTASTFSIHFGYWPDHLWLSRHWRELKPSKKYPSLHSNRQVSSNLLPVQVAVPFSSLTNAGQVTRMHFGISDSQKATFAFTSRKHWTLDGPSIR